MEGAVTWGPCGFASALSLLQMCILSFWELQVTVLPTRMKPLVLTVSPWGKQNRQVDMERL